MKNPNHVLMHFNPNTCLIFRVTTTIIKMSRLYCITYTSVGSGLIMSSFPPLTNRNERFMAISAILQLNRGFNLTIIRGKFKIKQSKDRKIIFLACFQIRHGLYFLPVYCESTLVHSGPNYGNLVIRPTLSY